MQSLDLYIITSGSTSCWLAIHSLMKRPSDRREDKPVTTFLHVILYTSVLFWSAVVTRQHSSLHSFTCSLTTKKNPMMYLKKKKNLAGKGGLYWYFQLLHFLCLTISVTSHHEFVHRTVCNTVIFMPVCRLVKKTLTDVNNFYLSRKAYFKSLLEGWSISYCIKENFSASTLFWLFLWFYSKSQWKAPLAVLQLKQQSTAYVSSLTQL